MLFGVQERIAVLNRVLPDIGNALTLRILMEFKKEASFTEQEKKEIKLVEGNGQVRWDDKLEKKKEIEVGETMKNLIVTGLKRLDEAQQLIPVHLPLYDRFVPTSTERS